jgi:hypothetical protein
MPLLLVSVIGQKLAAFKDRRIKASCGEIAGALTGDYRPELVFILQQELQLYEFYQAQIAATDAQIEQCLGSFADKVDVTSKPLAKLNAEAKSNQEMHPNLTCKTSLYRISGVDFTQIDGFGALTVLTLLSEVGLDPSRFPTVKHFTSWLGLCPGSRITGGKIKSSRTRPVANRAGRCFSHGSTNSVPLSLSYVSHFIVVCRRVWERPRQLLLPRIKSARIFYRLWTSGGAYTDPGIDAYERQSVRSHCEISPEKSPRSRL